MVNNLGVFDRLRNRVRRVKPQLWKEKSWILCLDHSSYSPALARIVFLFLKIKNITLGQHLGNVNAIKQETTRMTKGISTSSAVSPDEKVAEISVHICKGSALKMTSTQVIFINQFCFSHIR